MSHEVVLEIEQISNNEACLCVDVGKPVCALLTLRLKYQKRIQESACVTAERAGSDSLFNTTNTAGPLMAQDSFDSFCGSKAPYTIGNLFCFLQCAHDSVFMHDTIFCTVFKKVVQAIVMSEIHVSEGNGRNSQTKSLLYTLAMLLALTRFSRRSSLP